MGSEHKVGKEHDQRMKGWNIDAHTTSAHAITHYTGIGSGYVIDGCVA